jgi:hypothetical protein
LALEQPVAKVDGKIDLVVLRDIEDVFLVLHVHRHELVANFWRVFGVVNRAEELPLNVLLQLDIAFKFDALALNFLSPAVLVEALSEEDHVGEDRAVVILVDPVAHPVEIERENLVHQHVLAVSVCEAVVIPLPLFGVR